MASDLRTHFGAFAVDFTAARGDGRHIAQKAAGQGTKLIIACGGDGTISEVANGILESNQQTELGILPSGSGGDFRRTLKLPTNTAAAARVLRKGSSRLIDVGRVGFLNPHGQHETRFFINVASFGLSPDVLTRTSGGDNNKWSSAFGANRIRGKLSYAMSTVSATLAASAKDVYLQFDEKSERRLKIMELCIANARYFGGAMKIAPDAKLDDGWFDIVTIGDIGALKILTSASRLYFGSHLSMAQVGHALAKRVTARAANEREEMPVELDGELVGSLPATFQIIPQALRVRCP